MLAGRFPIAAVVTQPDRQRGRGRKPSPSPIAELALDAGTPLLRPERVGDAQVVESLRSRAPDLGVVVAFGQFLPKTVRELPRLGYLINAHASLLPRYRGAAPIARSILSGETRTGISVMRVEREMDAGPVALTRELAVRPEENCGELSERLAVLAAECVDDVLEQIVAKTVCWTPQDHSQATLAPKLDPKESRIDWHESSEALVRRIRALAPRPGAYTTYDGRTLRVLSAAALAGPVPDPPGIVRRGSDPALRIATGDGWLAPLRLQRAGGRTLDVEAFLRGRPIADGARLGDDSDTGTIEPR